ncbi:MAG: cupredoxin domain-containing protein [Actinomycetota bacterium]|nr:cupredoxin domain-containing protein [Actinomycetota bacterium]
MSRLRRTGLARLAALLAPLALLAVGCGGSGGGAQSTSAGKTTSVTIKNIAFQPVRVEVAAGQTVTWRFEDSATPHTVTAADGSFDSGTKTSGRFSHRFDKPGTYDYTCTIHPQQMRGTVVVT